ncbi:MAG: outer membrane beta-barrel protein [Bacteriovoracaceae bacterium]|jgi:hypothetical protein|nr:hypothetical protein [Halobacteriovoraceae bacterium]MDP7321028.1 outer membrane beta-barrel protein [Bacteriovoracaceae bacterium]|tara:strand:- start:216 stop:743 length:528 start_codon:yes stop_codon:yes gene_type:complete
MKLRILMALMVSSFSLQSFAGLLIDPYVGVGQTKSTVDFLTTDETDTEPYNAFGARLGYSFLLISAGIDYEMAKSESDGEDVDITNTSVFVGVDLPILLRAWAEYFISSDLDVDGSTADYEFSDGYGIGVGFTGLPFVSLNLEIQNLNYDITQGSLKGDLSTASTIFSVSLPLDL